MKGQQKSANRMKAILTIAFIVFLLVMFVPTGILILASSIFIPPILLFLC